MKKLLTFLFLVMFSTSSWAADTATNSLGELLTPAADDVVPIVDISGTPTTKKIQVSNLVGLVYYADSTEADHGIVGSGRSLKDLKDLIGSNYATIKLNHHGSAQTDYIILTSLTMPDNITISPSHGAMLSDSGGTANLTIEGPIEAGNYKWIDWTGTGSTKGTPQIDRANAKWFGATGDGSTNDTAALQLAINTCSWWHTELFIPQGHYKFTKLYLHYDSTNNSGFNSDLDEQGILSIRGAGEIGEVQYDGSEWNRTILESTDGTGPAISHALPTGGTGYTSTNIKIRDLTVIAENTTYVLSLVWFHSKSFLEDLYIKQKSTSGSGILIQETYTSNLNRVVVHGLDSSNKGVVGIRIYNEATGGGMDGLQYVTVRDFVTGYLVGGETYNDGTASVISDLSFKSCQAGDCTVGWDLGWNIKGVTLDHCFAEDIGHTAIRLNEGVKSVTIKDCNLHSTTSSNAQIDVGYLVGAGGANSYLTYGTVIEGNFINVPDTDTYADARGIRVYGDSANTCTIKDNVFWPITSSKGTGIRIEQGENPQGLKLDNNLYVSLGTDIEDLGSLWNYVTNFETGQTKWTRKSVTLGVAATTINVNNSQIIQVTGDAGGNTITTFTDETMKDGTVIWLRFVDALVTLQTNAGSLNLSSTPWTSWVGAIKQFICVGTTWHEVNHHHFDTDDTAAGAGADGTISSRSANALGECDGFLKMKQDDGSTVYVPYWDAIAP